MFWLSKKSASSDAGFVAIVAAIAIGGILLASAALSIDLSAMQNERRELQNGAEAGAIAAAYACSFNDAQCAALVSKAKAAADLNASDSAAFVTSSSVCGVIGATYSQSAGSGNLSGCTAPRATLLCPRQPTNSNWIQVTASTLTRSGSSNFQQIFRSVIPGWSNTTKTIRGCAQAAWGPPGSFDGVIGIAVHEKCWNAWVKSVGAPYYTGYGPNKYENPATWEKVMGFSGNAVSGCVGESSQGVGFGWLDAVSRCTVNQDPATRPNSYNGWLQGDGGNNVPSNCLPMLNALQTTGFERSVLAVPVFDCVFTLGGGSGGPNTCPVTLAPSNPTSGKRYYHIVGYASWYLTGYRAQGNDNFRFPPSTSADYTFNNLAAQCPSSQTCIAGWFTRTTLAAKAEIGSDPNQKYYGMSVVGLVG